MDDSYKHNIEQKEVKTKKKQKQKSNNTHYADHLMS